MLKMKSVRRSIRDKFPEDCFKKVLGPHYDRNRSLEKCMYWAIANKKSLHDNYTCMYFFIVDANVSVETSIDGECLFSLACSKNLRNIVELFLAGGYNPWREAFMHDRNHNFWRETKLQTLLSRVLEVASEPKSLQDTCMCCFSIRKTLGKKLPDVVESLCYPAKLKDLIKLTHISPTPVYTDCYSDSDDISHECYYDPFYGEDDLGPHAAIVGQFLRARYNYERSNNSKREERLPERSRWLHEQGASSRTGMEKRGLDKISPRLGPHIRPEGARIASKNSSDSVGGLLAMKPSKEVLKSSTKVTPKNIKADEGPPRTTPVRTRLEAKQNYQRNRGSEMAGIMCGESLNSTPQTRSLRMLQKSEDW